MILDVAAVVRDGSKPAGTIPQALPAAFPVSWPRAEDGTLRLTVRKQDLSAFDLTGSTVVFGVRRYPNDELAEVSRQATIIDAPAGRADVPIVQADTIGLTDDYEYWFDVQLTDASGRRWQIVPRSLFKVAGIFAQPADSVTVPPASSPLALGPSWLELGWAPEVQTDATTAEQLSPSHEVVWNFDDGTASLANLFGRLTALARVSGGTETIRVRYGGTAGQPDGTVLLTSDPLTGTSYALLDKFASAAKPTGTQLVKVTMQNDTAGQRTYLRALALRARGAA